MGFVFKYLLGKTGKLIADDEMIKFLENDIVSQLMHIIETPLFMSWEKRQ